MFYRIISLNNLFLAWREFKTGKTKKIDVIEFQKNLKYNILSLHNELKTKIYNHSEYFSFYVKDPKLRLINKACVKDRVLHHSIFRILYLIFDKTFIFDSYSCRINKGTHGAVNRLNDFARKVSKNNTKTCFVFKLDVRKFFDSIDQDILISLIKKKINNKDAIWLIENIIKSFSKGLPPGNITSQLFANIYLNEPDKFVKHKLKIKYYIRYCDDFVILSDSRNYLENLIFKINNFLEINLKLYLHPNKIEIRKYNQGIDFLGYVSFPYFRILRVRTLKRIIKNLKTKEAEVEDKKRTKKSFDQMVQSYLGVLKHCDSLKIRKKYFFKHIGMIIFLYGEDNYRSKKKLEEIVEQYKQTHKSGLNLIELDIKEGKNNFEDFYSSLRVNSMFAEKKLIILKNVFCDKNFQEDFLKQIDFLNNSKDIVAVFENEAVDERSKFFKILKKESKSQEFNLLSGGPLLAYIDKEFEKYKAKIDPMAKNAFLNCVGNNLWLAENEIKKLVNYKSGKIIKKEDIELMMRPKIENDIFKTIEAIASKNKKQAIFLLHKHIDNGDNVLYLLSMIAYQFRNLLIIKESPKNSGLHPFVVQKSFYLCNQFSFEQLKKIYQKIFLIDLNIKTGKIDAETALDLLVSQI